MSLYFNEEKMICRILLLLILTSCVSGSFVVNVTQTSYQAEENHNITLEWTFTTSHGSPKSLSIYCRLVTGNKVFFFFHFHLHGGVEVSESPDAKFSGRVQSDKDALREGRIRLQLSRLRTDDSGRYRCAVQTNYGFDSASCQLNVTAVADYPPTQIPTFLPLQASRTRTLLYISLGLIAAALLALRLIAGRNTVGSNS